MGLLDFIRRRRPTPAARPMVGDPYRTAQPPPVINVDLAEQDSPASATLDEVSADGVEMTGEAYLRELRLPTDEVLNTHGKGDPSFYERLQRDDQVYPTFRRRRATVVARELKVEPGGEQPIDKEAADHLRAQLKRLSFDQTCMKMLNGLMAGYGVGECIFHIPAGSSLVELRAIKVRRSGRFRFRNDKTLVLITSKHPQGLEMPARKFWVFSSGAEDDDDPYGRGLGHYLYWPVWFKRNSIRFWSIFLERFAQPAAKATVPAGSTEEKRKEFLELLGSFVSGGRIVIPRGVDLELIQAAKDSGGDYERFINLLNAAIAKIIVTTTMTTDNGSSLSQGEVHERGELTVVKSDAAMLDESFMQGPAKWLTEWNFPGAATPLVYRDFSEAEDLAKRADRDVKLSQMGYRLSPQRFAEIYGDGYEYSAPVDPTLESATGPAPAAPAASSGAPSAAGGIQLTGTDLATVVTVNEARRSSGLPALALPSGQPDPDGFLTVAEFKAKREAKGEAIGGAVGQNTAANLAEPVRDAILAASTLIENGGWREVLGPEVEGLERLLDGAKSLEDVRDRLGELALSDPTKLSDALGRLIFAGRVAGQEDADAPPLRF